MSSGFVRHRCTTERLTPSACIVEDRDRTGSFASWPNVAKHARLAIPSLALGSVLQTDELNKLRDWTDKDGD